MLCDKEKGGEIPFPPLLYPSVVAPPILSSPRAEKFAILKLDELVKSAQGRRPGESRDPERLEITGFRLPPE
jgi:hypothetical protein